MIIKKSYDFKLPCRYVKINSNGTSLTVPRQLKKLMDNNIPLGKTLCTVSSTFTIPIIDVAYMGVYKKLLTIDNTNKCLIRMDENELTNHGLLLWKIRFQKESLEVLKAHGKNEMIMGDLLNHQRLNHKYKPLKISKHYRVIIKDAIDWNVSCRESIIDNIQTSKNVPFVYSEGIYKLFSSGIKESYKNFLSYTQDSITNENIIYIYVWNGKNVCSKNSYIRCEYNASSFILEIPDIDGLLETLLLAMPFFNFVKGEISYINAELIYDISPNLNLFMYMIDQDPTFSHFLTIFEKTNVRDEVLFPEVSWRSSQTSLRFSIKSEEEKYTLSIMVMHANNVGHIDEIAKILGRLLSRYKDNYAVYKESIENEIGVFPEERIQELLIPSSKNDALKTYYPEIFDVNKYTKKCQNARQPIIISHDEMDSWKKMKIGDKERQVGVYPPGQDPPTFYFVCPDDRTPWPFVTFIEEGNVYLPCCGKEDRWAEYKDYNRGPYASYFNTITKKVKSKVLKTYYPVEEASFGYLPQKIEYFLSMGDKSDGIWMHYNTGSDVISSVAHAVGSKDDQREIRIKLANYHPSLYAQENVGIDEFNLYNMILHDDKLSASTIYRGLEELFNINIYVLNQETEELELPESKVTHIRLLRDRPCVILWFHPKTSEYELVVKIDDLSQSSKKKKTMTFDMYKHLWDMIPISHTFMDNNFVYVNIYSEINYEEILEAKIVAQMIDAHGKARGFNLSNGLTVYTLPTQPLLVSKDFKDTIVTKSQAQSFFASLGPILEDDEYIWLEFDGIEKFLGIRISKLSQNKELNKNNTHLFNSLWWAYLNGSTPFEYRTERDVDKFFNLINIKEGEDPIVSPQKLKKVNGDMEALELIDILTLPLALHNSMKCKIKRRQRELDGLRCIPTVYLHKIYNSEDDYNQSDAFVFTSLENLRTWITTSETNEDFFINEPKGKLSIMKFGDDLYHAERIEGSKNIESAKIIDSKIYKINDDPELKIRSGDHLFSIIKL